MRHNSQSNIPTLQERAEVFVRDNIPSRSIISAAKEAGFWVEDNWERSLEANAIAHKLGLD